MSFFEEDQHAKPCENPWIYQVLQLQKSKIYQKPWPAYQI